MANWLPRSWNICFVDLHSSLLVLFSKVHQPPGWKVVWHATVLPAPNTAEREVRFTGEKLARKMVLGSGLLGEEPSWKGESQALLPAPTSLFFAVCDNETWSLSKLGWVMAAYVTTEYELTRSPTSESKASDHSSNIQLKNINLHSKSKAFQLSGKASLHFRPCEPSPNSSLKILGNSAPQVLSFNLYPHFTI